MYTFIQNPCIHVVAKHSCSLLKTTVWVRDPLIVLFFPSDWVLALCLLSEMSSKHFSPSSSVFQALGCLLGMKAPPESLLCKTCTSCLHAWQQPLCLHNELPITCSRPRGSIIESMVIPGHWRQSFNASPASSQSIFLVSRK